MALLSGGGNVEKYPLFPPPPPPQKKKKEKRKTFTQIMHLEM